MAEPNLLNPSSIKGKTVCIKAPANTPITILSNPSESGKILKVNSLSVFYDGTGSMGYILVNNIKFDKTNDTGHRYQIINRDEMIYLQEGQSITWAILTGSGQEIMFTVSYEEIS